MLIIIGVILMYLYFFARMGMMYYSGKLLNLPKEHNISLFYSSGTNMTISTAIAISTFGPLAAVGVALGGPFSDMILMIVFAKFFQKYQKEKNSKGVLL